MSAATWAIPESAPTLGSYQPPAQPYDPSDPLYAGLRSYQVRELSNAIAIPAWAWYADPRLGKTRIATRSILRWIREGGARRILILGPLEPLRLVWTRELEAVGFWRPSVDPNDVAPHNGYLVPLIDQPIRRLAARAGTSKAKRQAPTRIAVIQDLIRGAAGDYPTVLLVNDEVLGQPLRKRQPGDGAPPEVTDLLMEWRPDVLIYDESHRIKAGGTTRARAAFRLGHFAKYKRLLSGTPDPNGYVDLFHQAKVLDESIWGTNKADWLRRFARTSGQWNHRIDRYEHVEQLFSDVRRFASIIRAADFFDVPAANEIVRETPLPHAAADAYTKLVREQSLELAELGVDVDATHILARLTRCAQLTAGFLPSVEGPPIWLHDAKVDAVVADVGELLASGGKVIISHRFSPEVERHAAALRKRYGERTVLTLDGSTRPEDRRAAVAPFSLDENVESDARILIVQEQVGGVGLSFGRADHLIFTSWSCDFATVEQMRKRIWDVNKRYMTIAFIAVPKTVDRFNLATVRRKANATVMAKSIGYAAAAQGADE